MHTELRWSDQRLLVCLIKPVVSLGSRSAVRNFLISLRMHLEYAQTVQMDAQAVISALSEGAICSYLLLHVTRLIRTITTTSALRSGEITWFALSSVSCALNTISSTHLARSFLSLKYLHRACGVEVHA